jgi:hypothetical protein
MNMTTPNTVRGNRLVESGNQMTKMDTSGYLYLKYVTEVGIHFVDV